MGLGVRGLEEFGLNLKALKSLGDVPVHVRVSLAPKMYDRRLVHLPHQERLALFMKLKARSIAHVLRIWPNSPSKLEGPPDVPYGFHSTVQARMIPKLVLDKEIDSIEILRIPGHRKRRVKRPRTMQWYAVRAFVAIEVEGQTRGTQTTEDRILVVKAYSEEDAQRRLKAEWKSYEDPSMNSEGYLFRWKMQKIVDVYELAYDTIDPKGTEVYSKLGTRRLKQEYQWHPFKTSNQAL